MKRLTVLLPLLLATISTHAADLQPSSDLPPVTISLQSTPTESPHLVETTPVTDATAERQPDVHFVPTPEAVVEAMLEMANVKKEDVVYDLGCGDGRFVITAAKKYGARGVGIDIDPQRIAEARENAKEAGVEDRVKFLTEDLFQSDIREATVITLYLLESLNKKLRPKILAEARPGTRVVSHAFSMGDWLPEEHKNVSTGDSSYSTYFWIVPANMSGRWKITSKTNEAPISTATIEQEFQMISAFNETNGETRKLGEGKVTGDAFDFTVEENVADGQQAKVAGRIKGNKIEATAEGAGKKIWHAEREPGTELPVEPRQE